MYIAVYDPSKMIQRNVIDIKRTKNKSASKTNNEMNGRMFTLLVMSLMEVVKAQDPILTKVELQSAISTYTSSATIAKYGTIENWDVSKVSDMTSVFGMNQGTFNADISKWNTERVANMGYSTYISFIPFFYFFFI